MATAGKETALNVKLLRDSLKAISHKGDELVATFYDILFSRYPVVRPLFDNVRMPEQKAKFLRSIVLVVRNLEKPEIMVPYLQGLCRMHVAYGAQAAHYDAFGECLLEAAGPDRRSALWSDDLAVAWDDAYGAIADLMKQGGQPCLK